MKIGIDFSRGEMEYRTGVEWYSYYIVKHLLDLGAEHEIILYSRSGILPSFCKDMPKSGIRFVHLRWPFRFGWTQFRLSWEMLTHPPDVLFVPSHIVPLITPKRVVTMIHDVAFNRHPQWYSKKQRRALEWGIRQVIKKQATVLAPTDFVKQELMKLYPETSRLDIRVIHHGVDREVFLMKENVSSLTRPYFLFIGRLESKKNISHIIDAFVQFGQCSSFIANEREKRRLSSDVDLVLVGRPGFGYEIFAHKLNYQHIHVIPFASTEGVVELYQRAIALVFPTLYEGFGMPILEAMACGCPVITSNRGANAEIAGDAGLLVDPEDIESIQTGLRRASEESTRQLLIAKGRNHIIEFSWQRVAMQTMNILCGK